VIPKLFLRQVRGAHGIRSCRGWRPPRYGSNTKSMCTYVRGACMVSNHVEEEDFLR